MMMINSNSLENQLDKHLCHTKTYDDINNNHQYELDNCDENTMKSDCLSLNDNNQTTLLTTTTTTTTVEVKVKTTKTASRKRKLNHMNNEPIVQTQPMIDTNKKKNSRMTKIESNGNNTVDQSSSTDEAAFGSCEPGTNVVLQGIVWNETDKGVLVVNITWRGKTYVGALLNTTEQNWAPPRYKPEVRSTKSNTNSIREPSVVNLPSIHESTERILRNGKRRGSSTTVTPNSTTKTRSFKIPETPKTDKLSQDDENLQSKNTNILIDDDNYSSRSVSPTTSAISTISSSPPLLSNQDNLSTTPTNSLVSYHFPDQILFPSQMYFNSLPSTN